MRNLQDVDFCREQGAETHAKLMDVSPEREESISMPKGHGFVLTP